MKDAVVTVWLRSALRRRIQRVATREGRSLSTQIERMVEAGLRLAEHPPAAGRERGPRPLGGLLGASAAPSLQDFRDVRLAVSRSLTKRR